MNDDLLKKWESLIIACKNYYIDSVPTGFTDAEYDELEKRALAEDNFSVRDYIFDTYYTSENKIRNHYIEKIKKEKVVDDTMENSLKRFEKEFGRKIYIDLKYDGSSLAIYLDPTTGKPKRIVTVGNSNIEDFGVDQTQKLMHFLPEQFPKGIVAIQAEALIDVNRFNGDPNRARQKANGLINSKYCEQEVDDLLTLRAYRYYVDDSPAGIAIGRMDYAEVIRSFKTTYSPADNHVLFSPADVFTTSELGPWCENDIITTSTGTFLADGMVIYDEHGICQKAHKFAGAGSGTEGTVRTKVLSIIWNNQVSKGKDSWSANVLIEPIKLRGVEIKKPSAGSVSKLVKNRISKGAEVSIILANSTIPMIGDTFSPGNGDFQFPTCTCGYHLSEKDIYGSNLKCGNVDCKERYDRMVQYLGTLKSLVDLDLNKLLVIDRFKWQETNINIPLLIDYVVKEDEGNYYGYLRSFLKTDMQIKNLDLVWKSSFKSIKSYIESVS